MSVIPGPGADQKRWRTQKISKNFGPTPPPGPFRSDSTSVAPPLPPDQRAPSPEALPLPPAQMFSRGPAPSTAPRYSRGPAPYTAPLPPRPRPLAFPDSPEAPPLPPSFPILDHKFPLSSSLLSSAAPTSTAGVWVPAAPTLGIRTPKRKAPAARTAQLSRPAVKSLRACASRLS